MALCSPESLFGSFFQFEDPHPELSTSVKAVGVSRNVTTHDAKNEAHHIPEWSIVIDFDQSTSLNLKIDKKKRVLSFTVQHITLVWCQNSQNNTFPALLLHFL